MKMWYAGLAIIASFFIAHAGHAQTICNKTTYTINSLAVSSIAGAAVNIVLAGKATCGGWVIAPSATICINLKGSAGTATSGDTTCFAPATPFYFPPMAGAISANSSTNPAAIAGASFN